MSDQEATIELAQASEGMVLAQPVCDAGGAVLLPRGATLSAASLASLGRRGIAQLQVVREACAADLAAQAAERERQCQRIEHLFRRSAGNGASAVLSAYLRAYRNGETA